jgi:hypothetical protein
MPRAIPTDGFKIMGLHRVYDATKSSPNNEDFMSANPIEEMVATRPVTMPLVEQDVILIIADISGYTEFMLANHRAAIHGQLIINELIEAIIEEVEIPLEVAKLEGDAVFLYALKDSSAADWEDTKRQIGGKLMRFFSAFADRLEHLHSTGIGCNCGACANSHNLKLKVIVHSGQAAIYKLRHFVELAGVDVIIVHRLLKNSVNLNEYILLTDAAYHDVAIPGEPSETSSETYDYIGDIKTHIYHPHL